jgi:hypothetical protein
VPIEHTKSVVSPLATCFSLILDRRKLYHIYISIARSFFDITTRYMHRHEITTIYTLQPAPAVRYASAMSCNRRTISLTITPHQSVT